MKVSLILPSYGRCDDVERCLLSLAAQTEKDFEVLLIDQNPDDRLVAPVAKGLANGLQLKHLRTPIPNLSAARNIGIREARGNIFGFPDDDCWYEPDTVAQICKAFAGGAVLQGVVAHWVEQVAQHGNPDEEKLSLEKWRGYRGGDASSITLFFTRAVFDHVGEFDERFGVGRWYGAAEEIDFILRVLSAGIPVVRCAAAKIHHHFSDVLPGRPGTQARNARHRARGTGGIYAKHRLSFWVVLRGFVAPALRALCGQLAVTGSVGYGLAVGLGRLEGFVHWQWCEPRASGVNKRTGRTTSDNEQGRFSQRVK